MRRRALLLTILPIDRCIYTTIVLPVIFPKL
jgi:hypothetical protein